MSTTLATGPARDDLWTWPATRLVTALRQGSVSPVEVVDAVLAQVERQNPLVNAVCTVTADAAVTAAKEAQRRHTRSPQGQPLWGVPFTLKDLTDTAGVRTTMGSALFADRVPAESSVVAERMLAAGGILVGKTNTPDHGCKGTTNNSVFGETTNPWDGSRTSGGSSGGAAAAVACGMAPLAEGSDFAGSIRIPASLCGIVGFKPSTGRVPVFPNEFLWHPVAFVNGPMARTVEDIALMLDVIAGPDPRDPTSLPEPHDRYLDEVRGGRSPRPRLAWTEDLGFALVDKDVRTIFLHALDVLRDEVGCEIAPEPTTLDDTTDAYQLLNATLRSGVMADHHPQERSLFDPLLALRVEHAQARSAADVAMAERSQSRLYQQVRRVFETADFLVLPTTPSQAFPLDQQFQSELGGVAVDSPFRTLPLTFTFNLTGHPAISVPAGWTRDGLPVGLQVVGRWRDDASVLRLAAAFERVAPWDHRWPPTVTAESGRDDGDGP